MNKQHKSNNVWIFIGAPILIGIIICIGVLFYPEIMSEIEDNAGYSNTGFSSPYHEPTSKVNDNIGYSDSVLPSLYDKTMSEVKALQNSRHGYDTSENAHKAYDIIIDALSKSALEQRQREALEFTRNITAEYAICFEMSDNMFKRYEAATSSGDPYKISKVLEEINAELNAKIPSLSDVDAQSSFYKFAHDSKDGLESIRGEIAEYEREYSFAYDKRKVEYINKAAEKDLNEARSFYNKGKGRLWDDQSIIAQGLPHVNRVINTSLVSAPHRLDAEKLRGLIVGELFSNYLTAWDKNLPPYEKFIGFPELTIIAKQDYVRQRWKQKHQEFLEVPDLENNNYIILNPAKE